MKELTVDIESFSTRDITTVGSYRYIEDPEFQVLLLSYAADDGPVVTIDLMETPAPADSVARAKALLFDASIRKHAHNAAFEWYGLSKFFNLTRAESLQWLQQWEDTQLHVLYCGLPASLDNAGAALQLDAGDAKMKEGKALIKYFCVPCVPTKTNGGRTRNLPKHAPDRWEIFKTYNGRDVTAERELDRRLAAWPVPEALNQQWRDDIEMNARGVGIDRPLTNGALICAAESREKLLAEFKTLTQLDNPGSPKQLLDWLGQHDAELDDLRKETVSHALQRKNLPPETRRALELRQLTSKTSNAKYDAIKDAAGDDDRFRGTLKFYGANRTGRWAGRLLQVQNLPQTHMGEQADQTEVREIIRRGDAASLECIYGSVNDVLSQMIRTVLVPQDGKWFIDADFSAIEARLVAWEAGENWVLDVFRTTGKIYEATASRMFGIPVENIVKGRPEYAYRQRGKVATLALGYQGGVPAMRRMDKGHALDNLSDGEIQEMVNLWRQQNPHIKQMWGRMQRAAVETISTGRATRPLPNVRFRLERSINAPFPFLTMQIPSGRKLFYANPGTLPGEYGDRISYWEQTNHGWAESETYGGKLTENLTQACGRDCLAFALHNLKAAGYEVVFHVHDEAIVEIATQTPDTELQNLVEIMRQVPPWAEGLPLNAEGWYGKFYTKD